MAGCSWSLRLPNRLIQPLTPTLHPAPVQALRLQRDCRLAVAPARGGTAGATHLARRRRAAGAPGRATGAPPGPRQSHAHGRRCAVVIFCGMVFLTLASAACLSCAARGVTARGVVPVQRSRLSLLTLSPCRPFFHCLLAGGNQQALAVALHMQLAALESAALPPLVLPPDVLQWLEEQLEAAQAAPPPVLPHPLLAAAQQRQQQPGSPSLRQKRKYAASASPPGQALRQAPAPAAAAQRSWAAVVAGAGPAARVQAPAPAPAQGGRLLMPAPAQGISSLPLWEQLRQRLDVEKAQAAGLRDHAMLAATGMGAVHATPLPAWQPQQLRPLENGVGGSCHPSPAPDPSSSMKSPLLQQLQAAASAERAAAERLARLAQ